MQVDLNTFVNTVNHANGNQRVIAVRDGNAKTINSFQNLFVSRSIHRATMNIFLDAYDEKYGGYLGKIARSFLIDDIEEGKPLTCNNINFLIDYGQNRTVTSQTWCANTLAQDPNGKLSRYLDFAMRSVCGRDFKILPRQLAQIKKFTVECMPQFQHMAAKMPGSFESNLQQTIEKASSSLLKSGIKLVVEKLPYKSYPGTLEEKLSVMRQLAVDGDLSFPEEYEILTGVVLASMNAILAAANGEKMDRGAIFNGTFPLASTGEIKRPNDAELTVMPSKMFQKLMQDTFAYIKENPHAENLSEESVFFAGNRRGGSNFFIKSALSIGMTPYFVYSAKTNTVFTLKDYPAIQEQIIDNSKYPDLAEVEDLAKKNLGLSNPPRDCFSPMARMITFETESHTDSEPVKISIKTFVEAGASNEEQLKKLTRDISNQIDALSQSVDQRKSLTIMLTPDGVSPLFYFVKSLGAYGIVDEPFDYSYDFKQNKDASVDVTITLFPEVSAETGMARFTVRIDPQGESEVTGLYFNPADGM